MTKGCNAAVVLPRESLGDGPTRPPPAAEPRPVNAWVDAGHAAPVLARAVSMHGELWITGWDEHEDVVPQHVGSAYSGRKPSRP